MCGTQRRSIGDDPRLKNVEEWYERDLASITLVRALSTALLGGDLEYPLLARSAELYRRYAATVTMADWHEYVAKDYVEYFLISLLAGDLALAERFLSLPRPLGEQQELSDLYSRILDSLRIDRPSAKTAAECAAVVDMELDPSSTPIGLREIAGSLGR